MAASILAGRVASGFVFCRHGYVGMCIYIYILTLLEVFMHVELMYMYVPTRDL